MGFLILLFIVVPFVEFALLARVGGALGFGPTLLLVVAMGVLGALVAKRQGRRVLSEWQSALAEGRVPEEGIASGVLALFGAVLLITPGFLTDFVGLLLLVPFVRRAVASALRAHLAQQVTSGRVRVVSMGGMRAGPPPTEVGRVRYRPSDVIDTEGEEIE